MNKEKFFIQNLHKSSKRDYLKRMNENKVKSMVIGQKFDKNYWDGDKKYGYGGYRYIKDRWKPVALKIIKKYKLKNNSYILDVGCGKGYLLYEIKKLLPNIKIFGIDISKYAKENAHDEIRKNIKILDASAKYPYKKNFFDLVISINTLHNLDIKDLKKSLNEIARVSKKSYVVVESFRNNLELFNLQCWALTCKSFFSKKEWIWIFKEFNYLGDFEFIYFQ
jgi:ubiquinone/menaquinone biosynthesis C-methylase UbiE